MAMNIKGIVLTLLCQENETAPNQVLSVRRGKRGSYMAFAAQ